MNTLGYLCTVLEVCLQGLVVLPEEVPRGAETLLIKVCAFDDCSGYSLISRAKLA